MAVMSKLSIRARNVDSNKNLPIIRAEDLQDLEECSLLPKNVTLFSTGMEKEEEEETHLQEALSALQFGLRSEKEATKCRASFIPIPESNIDVENYHELYSSEFDCSKQYIHFREKLSDEGFHEYDADSEDESWLYSTFLAPNDRKPALTKSEFEGMMEKLEKSSGQQVTTAVDAKALLKGEDDIIMQVYDYWLAKRLRWRQALLPVVKVDRRELIGDPYVAFRRRMDRVQTRKNRKNDEISYEKMLRLRKDFHRALEIIELMKDRENSKHSLLHTEIDIINLRQKSDEFNSVLYREVLQLVKNEMESRAQVKTKQQLKPINGLKHHVSDSTSLPERKRKKTRRDSEVNKPREKVKTELAAPSKAEESETVKLISRQFPFKRDPVLCYQAPSGVLDATSLPNIEHQYSLTNISTEETNTTQTESIHQFIDTNRNIGYCRRRIGRGGRIIFDRIRPSVATDTRKSDPSKINELMSFPGDTRCLPNELWSHFLDHSYSQFAEEYPIDIPVYLPTAKRHQSLPPSCDEKDGGSYSTTEVSSSLYASSTCLATYTWCNPTLDTHTSQRVGKVSSSAEKNVGAIKKEAPESVVLLQRNIKKEKGSNPNISYQNTLANGQSSIGTSSNGDGSMKSLSRFGGLCKVEAGSIVVQSPEMPKSLRETHAPLSQRRTITDSVVLGRSQLSTVVGVPFSCPNEVNAASVSPGVASYNRRGSNTAALLLNGEKAFGQSIPGLMNQSSIGSSLGCTVNNNNRSEVTRIPNGGIDHEMGGNYLLGSQTKQNCVIDTVDTYGQSLTKDAPRKIGSTIQQSTVSAAVASAQQHSALVSSLTGSIIS